MIKKEQEYIDEPKLSKTTKKGIRVISEMSTSRIIWFVMNRHRVGLLALSTVLSFSYIAYDKVVKYFV